MGKALMCALCKRTGHDVIQLSAPFEDVDMRAGPLRFPPWLCPIGERAGFVAPRGRVSSLERNKLMNRGSTLNRATGRPLPPRCLFSVAPDLVGRQGRRWPSSQALRPPAGFESQGCRRGSCELGIGQQWGCKRSRRIRHIRTHETG